ncbi:MAG: protein jag [Clostridia bacterium]|nr:protein jag [Clostridia bacterium]
MNFTEFTGKTVAEAIEKGLKELGLTEETAEIRVLEEGKKKLFGSVKARVEIAPKADAENTQTSENEAPVAETKTVSTVNVNAENGEKTDGERAVEFLEGLFEILNITAVTELVSEGEKIEINVTAANTNSIIGKRGVMLDAVQTLAGAVANTGRDEYKRVVVDCENYRENREETLKKLAKNLADKAIRLEKKIKLEPMNPYERRIIHAALSEVEGISTQSEGKEPNRYIVIIPANVADPDAPAMPARNEHGGRDRRNGGRDGGRGGRGGYGRGGNGGKGGFKKPYNNKRVGGFNRSGSSESTGGTSMKKSDFFGTFLGNSKDDE